MPKPISSIHCTIIGKTFGQTHLTAILIKLRIAMNTGNCILYVLKIKNWFTAYTKS